MSNVISSILNPQSVAVIGASRHKSKVGYQVLKNVIESNFKGQIYPVNPNARKILGLKSYPSIKFLPQVPETVIIVTPASSVPIILKEAADLKVQTAIIISAGFAETGPKGKQLQNQLDTIIGSTNIRVLGPNCLGVLSTHHQINATFGPALQKKGDTMIISQSGAMVTGIIDWATTHHLGISHAVTLGNRIDINENEVLEYAATDPKTNTILLYLESFADPKHFFSLASSITQNKPIIVLKGGRSAAGQAASASHTAALATDYPLTKAFAKQTGVILVDTLQQFLNTAALFSIKKPIKGLDLAIITNAGGPGVVSTDKAISQGLNIVPITKKSSKLLHKSLNLNHPQNPIDILGDALPEHFTKALNIIDKDSIQDAILIIITPQTPTKPNETAKAIVNYSKRSKKPVFVVLIGGKKMSTAKHILSSANIPVFDYPQEAIELISLKAKFEHHIKNKKVFPTAINSRPNHHLNNLITKDLSLSNAFTLLKEYQIPVPKFQIIDSLSEIHKALSLVGLPAVLKTADLSILHKKQSGGVYTFIMNTNQARIAYKKLSTIYPQVLVQQMISHQGEIIIGAKNDPQFGIFITVGLGGSLTDTLKDRQFAFFPTNKKYLQEIFSKTKASSLTKDKKSLTNQIVKTMYSLGEILYCYPTISEIEINPMLITDKTAYAADIKIQLFN